MTRRRTLLATGAAALLGPGPLLPALAAEHADPGPQGEAVTFPLTIRPGQRHLADASGRPFLIQGDSAWSLIAQLHREEVEYYLDDRRARGFNTLLVSLLEHRFSSQPPANAAGDQPFLTPGDYGTPNDAYFAHAAWVVEQAEARGFLVLLTPSYLGFQGGDEGWYQEMVANGPGKLHAYGRFVGERFRDRTNILWVQAGDFDPPDKDLVRAVANGIREIVPGALQTAHGGPETTALDHWRGEPWLQLNNVYSYKNVPGLLERAYADPSRLPFFLIESSYENEHGLTDQALRLQAYQAALAGSAGQVFGNNPIWHFGSGGLHPAPTSWQCALGGGGTRSMMHLKRLLAGRRWWTLRPDIEGALLARGRSTGNDQAVAAVADDRSFALVYLPTGRAIAVNSRQLADPRLRARWYDPAGGHFSGPVTPQPMDAGMLAFHPPRINVAGFDDWVLVLETLS